MSDFHFDGQTRARLFRNAIEPDDGTAQDIFVEEGGLRDLIQRAMNNIDSGRWRYSIVVPARPVIEHDQIRALATEWGIEAGTADYVDFTSICSHDVRPGISLPTWDDGGPYKGRATRGFIEDAYGPLPHDADLARIFHDHVEGRAKAVAADKLKANRGTLAQPVVLTGDDIEAL